jgi:hypothetical protein
MPDSDNYATEIAALRAALASGVLTVEAEGRRKTYRSASEIQSAIDHFDRLGGGRRRRRTRFLAASLSSGR